MTSGRTSDRMLMESVLVLEVGAAASRILRRAIMYWGRLGRMAWNKISTGELATSVSGYQPIKYKYYRISQSNTWSTKTTNQTQLRTETTNQSQLSQKQLIKHKYTCTCNLYCDRVFVGYNFVSKIQQALPLKRDFWQFLPLF